MRSPRAHLYPKHPPRTNCPNYSSILKLAKIPPIARNQSSTPTPPLLGGVQVPVQLGQAIDRTRFLKPTARTSYML